MANVKFTILVLHNLPAGGHVDHHTGHALPKSPDLMNKVIVHDLGDTPSPGNQAVIIFKQYRSGVNILHQKVKPFPNANF